MLCWLNKVLIAVIRFRPSERKCVIVNIETLNDWRVRSSRDEIGREQQTLDDWRVRGSRDEIAREQQRHLIMGVSAVESSRNT